MSNPIQSIRDVFNIAKNIKNNGKSISDEEIEVLLKKTVSDETLASHYKRFEKGYAAEDLFMRVFSLLPWVKLVIPLGQEQFPESSKHCLQVPDYEIIFEAGNNTTFSSALIEVKLVDNDKQGFELQKYKYNVLKEFARIKNEPLLFGVFWRKTGIWTINTIESFSEKSSSYKLSFQNAILDDLSAIFGDYTYIFRKPCYRKSIFSLQESIHTDFFHSHEKYGRTIYEGISEDGQNYEKLCAFEPAVLDCAFDFEEMAHKELSATETEIVEQYSNPLYIYKLSYLILSYLYKIYCFDVIDMSYSNNLIVENTFDIVDTVRRKCGGEIFYLVPYNINEAATKMIELQFGKVNHIMEAYKMTERKGMRIIVSHNN